MPNTRGPSQARDETATDAVHASSIEIDVSQEDFAAMANLARTTAGAALRTLEARSTPDHRVGGLPRESRWAQLFRKTNPLAAPGNDPRGIVTLSTGRARSVRASGILGGRDRRLPCVHRHSAKRAVRLGGSEMTLDVEDVVDGGMR